MRIIVVTLLFIASPCFALSVAPGNYEVSAVIVNNAGKVMAVFNAHTHSRLLVWLKGKRSEQLIAQWGRNPASGPKLMKVSFRVGKKAVGDYISAELTGWKPIPNGEKIPAFVGNNFKPLPKRK